MSSVKMQMGLLPGWGCWSPSRDARREGIHSLAGALKAYPPAPAERAKEPRPASPRAYPLNPATTGRTGTEHRALQPGDRNPFSGPTQKQEPLESQLQCVPDTRRGTSWHNEAQPCSFQYRGPLTVKSLDLNLSEAPYYCSCCIFNRICSCSAR